MIEAMQNQTGIPLINRRTENLVVYIILLILATIGLFVVPTGIAKGSAVLLLFSFGLLHTFGYHNTRTTKQLTLYFALQTLLVICLIWVAGASDAFSFLFFILGVQAMLVLPTQMGLGWIALFYLLDGVDAIASHGTEGVINLLFNAAVYTFTALFGYALRAAEIARRRNQELLIDLQAAQDKIKDLAVSEERNRLAREIHDGLGHYLTATTMQVQGAKAVLENSGVQVPLAVGALNKAETLLQEALADVRRSVASLRGAPTMHRPLAATIADLVNQPGDRDGFVVQFVQTGAPQPLPPQVEMTLYRVAQEGLTNVRKHAHATQATMTLAYGADKVHLQISDDGRGCATTTGGYGLLGLRERVQLVGGTVAIQSAPGQGFQLLVEIPVRQ
jgi:signal transduction histidine kinase